MEFKNELQQILTRSVNIAFQATEMADEASMGRNDDLIQSKIKELLALTGCLWAKARSARYDPPIRVIAGDTEFNLDHQIICRLFKRPRARDRQDHQWALEDSLQDVARLLGLMNLVFPAATAGENGDDLLVPPLDLEAEICFCIEEWIAECNNGSPSKWKNEVSLHRSGHIKERSNMFIEKVGVPRPMEWLKGRWPHDPANAVIVLRMLSRDLEIFERLVGPGVVPLFVKILREGPMVVQAEVAYTISQLVVTDPEWQRRFAQHQLIHLLIGHLASDIDEENLEDASQMNKATSVLEVVMATYHSNARKEANDEEERDKTLPQNEQDLTSPPCIKARMKAMAARALGSLAVGNSNVCRMISETRALMRFAVLLENGTEDVKYNSAMALMEITAMAEQDTDLRRSVFKASSHASKAIVDQLLKIIAKKECDSYLLIPCVKAIGNLARTFRETRPIQPLVQLLQLGVRDEVCKEALISLTKFICRENYMHLDHIKTMVSAGAEEYLVSLAVRGVMGLQKDVLVVLCYIILDVPNSKLFSSRVLSGDGKLMKYGVLSLFDNGHISKDETVQALVREAKLKFEI